MKVLASTGDFAAELAAAFDASLNPYVLLTADMRIAGMNLAYLEVTGREREDLLGKNMFEVFDAGPGPEARENERQLRASLDKVLATGERDHLALIHYAIPVIDEEGHMKFEDRYWSATHTPLKNADGAVNFILQHTTDITELERLRRRMQAAESEETVSALDAIIGGSVMRRAHLVQEDNRRLEIERNRLVEMFMQAPGFVAILTGPDHVFQLHNDAYAALIGRRDIAGKPVKQALPEVAGQGFFEVLDEVYATGRLYEGRESLVQLQRTPDGEVEDLYLDFIYQPIRNERSDVVGIFVQGHDVTANVRAAQRQKLMIDELNHRVKNTLATVQSIAVQTARSNPDPVAFAQTFQDRLMSLSHTHDLLTRSHWEGAELRAILMHETEAHGSHRLVLNGPAVALGPAAALSLGMIFHELATNAAKYGALSVGEGRVFVDWAVANEGGRKLTIKWCERGGPPVVEPDRRGFGTRLIERNIRHDLAGETKLSYAADGFIAEISIPLDRGDQ